LNQNKPAIITKLFIAESVKNESVKKKLDFGSKSKSPMIQEKKKSNNKLHIEVKENAKLIKSISPRRDRIIKDDFVHSDRIDYKRSKLQLKIVYEDLIDIYTKKRIDKKIFDLKVSNCISKYSVRSVVGKKSSNSIEKINQDSYYIAENFMLIKNYYSFCVCDGHGNFGHLVSGQAVKTLPANIHLVEINKLVLDKSSFNFKTNYINHSSNVPNHFIKTLYEKNHFNSSFAKNFSSGISSSISDGFQKTHQDIVESSIDTNYSGSTVCSIFLFGKSLFCANVGDSRAVLGIKDKEKWRATALSKDHKPDDQEEKKRILAHNGRVESYKSNGFINLDEDDEDIGPPRVWLKDEDAPGLAMSRSIGDKVARRAGVISDPGKKPY
jgi:serine/threonine protein phosphatase PrpC